MGGGLCHYVVHLVCWWRVGSLTRNDRLVPPIPSAIPVTGLLYKMRLRLRYLATLTREAAL